MDANAPFITINNPTNGSVTNDSTPELNATFSGETVAYAWYNLNNTGNSTPVSDTDNLTVSLSSLPDGAHNVTVYANDSGGNINSSIVYFTVDTTPPTAPTNLIHTDDAPGDYDNDNSIDISWSESFDTYSSVIYRIYRDGVLNGSTTSTTYTFTSETEGSHEYNVSANDSAGNINTSNVSVTVIVDYTDPVIHNVSLSDTYPGYDQPIVVSVNVTDTNTNIASVTAGNKLLTQRSGMLWNGTITAVYGTNTVTVTAYDNASNSATNTSLSYTGPDVPRDSGGVGIGVSSSNEPENVEETLVVITFLGDGSSSTYNFNDVITSVEVTPDRNYGPVAARIEVLAGRPGSMTSDLPDGVIFKYVNIFIGTTGWYEGKLSNSVINFQAPASWFKEYNVDPASVIMYWHNNGKWQPLETTLTEQVGGYYQYSSPTPGFHSFLILGQVGDSGTRETAVTPDSGTETDSTTTPEATSTKGIPIFWILLGIIAIILVLVYRKKNDDDSR